MNQLMPSLGVVVVLSLLTIPALHRFPRDERRLLLLSYFGHFVAAWVLLWMIYEVYGGSDVVWYLENGEVLADAMNRNFEGMAPEVLSLLLQRDSQLPVYVMGEGHSTGTMSAVAAFAIWIAGGSTYAASLLVAAASFYGKLGLHLALRDHFPAQRARVALAVTLFPSAVFWTSGVVKEGVLFAGFGWLIFGLHKLVHRRSLLGLAPALIGGMFVSLVKGYVLFPVVAGVAVWLYWEHAKTPSGEVRIKPGYLMLGIAFGVVGLVGLGELFPRFAFGNLAEEASRLQSIGQTIHGGSNYEVVDSPAQTLLGQLAYAPVALLTALFRPFIFEVRNVAMGISALETTVLTVLFVRILWKRSWRAVWHQVRSEPILIFSLTFILLFGIAVGLTTTNLGTLSRYRTPLTPFLGTLALVLSSRRSSPPVKGLGSAPRRSTNELVLS
jgi:hypothetical protein